MTTRPAAGALRAGLEHSRGGVRRGLDRVRTRWRFIAQAAVASGVAWELASLFQERPFFAPIAAVIALGAASGQHLRRAVELSFGVTVGILIADLILLAVPAGGITIGAAVGLSVTAALLFGAGQILVTQAAVSAALLATLGIPPGESSFSRSLSALVGVAIALVVGPIFLRRDPLGEVGRCAEALLDRLADALDRVAGGIATGDPDVAREALEHARSSEAELEAFHDALAAAEESMRLSPPRRRDLPRLAVYDEGVGQVELAVRNTRVLARGAETAAARGVPGDPDLVDAVRLLARAVRALGDDLREPSEAAESRRLAREAAAEATAVLDRRSDLAANVIVGSIRSTAADILRGSGMDTDEMRAALGPYPGGEQAVT